MIAAAAVMAFGCAPKSPLIKTKVQPRPAGQEDMIGFAADPIADVGIGIVGIGMRGSGAVTRLQSVPGCHIAALCDVEPDRVADNAKPLKEKGLNPNLYSGEEDSYKGLCEDPSVDLVYICTDWLHHVPVALYALEHGKHVAIEVPSALTLDDCWALVNTAERTRRHCMMLENCCYDFFELSTLALAQAGVFGEIIHVEGAYHHYLSEYWDEYWNNWRLDYNSKHRGDLYPTHGFGPVCQVLGIHRGDRLQTLVAMDTESFNGRKLVEDRGGDGSSFADGDLSATMIRTAKGKSILIEHDVMTPRPYNRMYQVVGTKGYAGKYPVQQVVVESESPHTPLSAEKLAEFQEKYPSPILNPEFIALAQSVGGHGGMDFIMDYRLIYCLNNGLPLDMDVYDLAEWCSLIELSRISMDNGCAPVEVPDFTRGAWDRVKGFTYAFAK